MITNLLALVHYIAAVLTDGDYLNDWLQHMAPAIQPAVELFGRIIARLCGC